jgi:hypothetical protein
MEKKCSKCEISKPLEQFPNDPRCSGGKRGACKECRLIQWVPEENEILTCSTCGDKKVYTLFSSRGKQKPCECKTCRNTRDLNKRNSDRDAYNKKQREDWAKNNEKRNAARRKNLQRRRDVDSQYRMKMALHVRLYDAVKRNKGVKSAKTLELLGCTVEQLQTFLEAEFTEGMTWENYGEWHIDHLRPCASFNLADPEEQKKCFHWTNLQPLWALDNIRKGDKWEEPTHSMH